MCTPYTTRRKLVVILQVADCEASRLPVSVTQQRSPKTCFMKQPGGTYKWLGIQVVLDTAPITIHDVIPMPRALRVFLLAICPSARKTQTEPPHFVHHGSLVFRETHRGKFCLASVAYSGESYHSGRS